MANARRFTHSRTAILGLFTLVSILLAIPLIVLMVQEQQDIRQFADETHTETIRNVKSGTDQKSTLLPTPSIHL